LSYEGNGQLLYLKWLAQDDKNLQNY